MIGIGLWLMVMMIMRAGEEYPNMPDAANQDAVVDISHTLSTFDQANISIRDQV